MGTLGTLEGGRLADALMLKQDMQAEDACRITFGQSRWVGEEVDRMVAVPILPRWQRASG